MNRSILLACSLLAASCGGGATPDGGAVDLGAGDLTLPSPTCSNGIQDVDESDVDCGGSCPPCVNGKACNSGEDCLSGLCGGGTCQRVVDLAWSVTADLAPPTDDMPMSTGGDMAGASKLAFAAPVTYLPNATPNALAAADFNGDKKLDVAISDDSSQSDQPGHYSVFPGAGMGALGKAVTTTTGVRPRRIIAGDFNDDGRLDLVTLDGGVAGAGAVSVLVNLGNGGFAANQDFPAGMSPMGFVAGDFNRDGKLDLAVSNDAPNGVPGKVTILLGDGKGGFHAGAALDAGFHPLQVAAADFNGDGKLDLVAAAAGDLPNDASSLTLFPGNGDGTFGASMKLAAPAAMTVTAGDLNGDGKIDLAFAHCCPSPTAGVLLGRGDGTFDAPISLSIPDSAGSIALADFDGDGRIDLAFQMTTAVAVLLGNGDGSFQRQRSIVAGTSLLDLAAADMDGDGKPDLVVADYGSNAVEVLLNATP